MPSKLPVKSSKRKLFGFHPEKRIHPKEHLRFHFRKRISSDIIMTGLRNLFSNALRGHNHNYSEHFAKLNWEGFKKNVVGKASIKELKEVEGRLIEIQGELEARLYELEDQYAGLESINRIQAKLSTINNLIGTFTALIREKGAH